MDNFHDGKRLQQGVTRFCISTSVVQYIFLMTWKAGEVNSEVATSIDDPINLG